MKHLKTKREITAKNLKAQDCEYKGFRLGFHKDENLYIIGTLWGPAVTFYETIKDLKLTFF
jgi:hypothetical protein